MPRNRTKGKKRGHQVRQVTESGKEEARLMPERNSDKDVVSKAAALPETPQKGVQLQPGNFSCPICLELLKIPVTTPCGHNFCLDCIKTYWDGRTISSCPQCRRTFTPRPDLMKNTVLADLVEELEKTEHLAAPASPCYAVDEDVPCDVCPGRWKLRSIKSCLVCLASYCEYHLQPHYQSPAFQKHKLVEPTENLQENICPRHNEVMKMFCRTDQQCICYLCSVDQHKDHDIVSAAAQRTEKQKELELSLQQRLEEIGKDEKVLDQKVEAVNRSADKAVEDSEKIFTEMIQRLQKRSSEVKQQITYKQKIEVRLIQDIQKKLQCETTKLMLDKRDLEYLSKLQDHTHFLLEYPHDFPPSAFTPSVHSSTINVQPQRHFEDVMAAVAKVRGQLEAVLTETHVDVVMPQPEPKTRAEFLRYSQELTLDPNTAHNQLFLSGGNRKVTLMKKCQPYPDHPDRFLAYRQVWSKESLTGRCYWEVKKTEVVNIAVGYRDVVDPMDSFGYDESSWALSLYSHSCMFTHDYCKDDVSTFSTSRLGVFLDHTAGLLSFYDVADFMTLIHRVQTTFTRPLHAGVGFTGFTPHGATAEFCKLRRST